MATTAQAPLLPQRLLNFFARYPPKLYSAQFANPARPPLTRPPKLSAKDKARKLKSISASSSTATSPIISQAASTTTETTSDDSNANITQTTTATTVRTSIPPAEIPSVTPSAIASDASTVTTTQTTPATPSTPSTRPDLQQTSPPPQTEEHHNPFLPWKNPITNRWRGPTISLRRQAELFKLARAHGIESLLPPSRKSSEYKEQKLIEKGLRVKGTGVGQRVKGHKWERMKAVQIEERIKAMEGMPELIRSWKQKGHGKWWKKYPR